MLVVMPKAGSRAPGTAVELLAAKAAKGTLLVGGTHVVVDVGVGVPRVVPREISRGALTRIMQLGEGAFGEVHQYQLAERSMLGTPNAYMLGTPPSSFVAVRHHLVFSHAPAPRCLLQLHLCSHMLPPRARSYGRVYSVPRQWTAVSNFAVVCQWLARLRALIQATALAVRH